MACSSGTPIHLGSEASSSVALQKLAGTRNCKMDGLEHERNQINKNSKKLKLLKQIK